MSQPHRINRAHAASIGQDTVRIILDGQYRTAAGRRVELRDLIERSVRGTKSYPPGNEPRSDRVGEWPTVVEVTNQSTLDAGKRLVESGRRVVALNFASAKNPGGGFLGGSRAQEESLCRASGLYAAIKDDPMYEYHRRRSDSMYTNYAIYSPDVPVFKDDDGNLLDEPWLCSFITAPAANAKVVLERDRWRGEEIREEMWRRVLKVLGIAAEHGHETLVLGAWGCGVFGNDT